MVLSNLEEPMFSSIIHLIHKNVNSLQMGSMFVSFTTLSSVPRILLYT